MSDISTDLQSCIDRMPIWNPKNNSYTTSDVPAEEYLRVTAQAMVYLFREVRDSWQESCRESSALTASLAKMKEQLEKIERWCDGYALEVFPEPNFKKASKVLKENGMSLDAISASNMRHVLNGVRELCAIESPNAVKDEECHTCGGTGWLGFLQGHHILCHHCHGTGMKAK